MQSNKGHRFDRLQEEVGQVVTCESDNEEVDVYPRVGGCLATTALDGETPLEFSEWRVACAARRVWIALDGRMRNIEIETFEN